MDSLRDAADIHSVFRDDFADETVATGRCLRQLAVPLHRIILHIVRTLVMYCIVLNRVSCLLPFQLDERRQTVDFVLHRGFRAADVLIPLSHILQRKEVIQTLQLCRMADFRIAKDCITADVLGRRFRRDPFRMFCLSLLDGLHQLVVVRVRHDWVILIIIRLAGVFCSLHCLQIFFVTHIKISLVFKYFAGDFLIENKDQLLVVLFVVVE